MNDNFDAHSWLRAFENVSGLSADEIITRCDLLPMDCDKILAFYMHTGRFPTDHEASFIADVGLNNFFCFYNLYIIPA